MSASEFDIIRRYFTDPIPASGSQIVVGPGDDCAVLNVPAGCSLCVSTDTLIEGVHFPAAATGTVAAQRSLGANLSDLAAMGASPFACTLALTLPGVDEVWLGAFSTALALLTAEFGIPLVGGNLARGQLSITFTVMGTVPIGQALRRGNAQVGDDIYVTGTLGDAGAGLAQLQKGEAAPVELVARYECPTPRVAFGQRLLGLAHAVIDISDGLVADLGHLLDSSHTGALINVSQLPLSTPLLDLLPRQAAQQLAMGAGDDYELCFSAPERNRDAIESAAQAEFIRVTRIGSITEGSGARYVDAQGESVVVESRGYDHFHAP